MVKSDKYDHRRSKHYHKDSHDQSVSTIDRLTPTTSTTPPTSTAASTSAYNAGNAFVAHPPPLFVPPGRHRITNAENRQVNGSEKCHICMQIKKVPEEDDPDTPGLNFKPHFTTACPTMVEKPELYAFFIKRLKFLTEVCGHQDCNGSDPWTRVGLST